MHVRQGLPDDLRTADPQLRDQLFVRDAYGVTGVEHEASTDGAV
ncbi:hypothetical protein [Streptomyces jumonjinensis]|nr:hypothetical protein [Streptomyces jumonjinensis]